MEVDIMATRTRKSSKEALDDKILKAKEDVQNYKEKYEAACATLKELEAKRDEQRKEELMSLIKSSNKSYEEILAFLNE